MGKGFKHGAGGSQLNFKVVGGTTEPSNPKENTIWVNTDKEITGWNFASEQPEDMKEGEVWFSTDTSSLVEFNALKKNGIQVYPLYAKQYVSGAWVNKTAKSYQGGEWVDWWNGELYDAGNEFEVYTGGWGADGYTSTGVISTIRAGTKATDCMYFVGVSGVIVLLATLKPINVDNFNTLYIEGEPISIYNNELSVGASINRSKIANDRIDAVNFHPKKGRQTISMDVSSVDGDVYVLVYGHSNSSCQGRVYRIWFE